MSKGILLASIASSLGIMCVMWNSSDVLSYRLPRASTSQHSISHIIALCMITSVQTLLLTWALDCNLQQPYFCSFCYRFDVMDFRFYDDKFQDINTGCDFFVSPYYTGYSEELRTTTDWDCCFRYASRETDQEIHGNSNGQEMWVVITPCTNHTYTVYWIDKQLSPADYSQ